MRIFVASAAELLTDHLSNGEGLIAWNLLERLAARGHEIVACAGAVDLRASPTFEVVAVGRECRITALGGVAYEHAVRRELKRRGGSSAFDVGHWLFPQHPEFAQIPSGLPFVIGPLSLSWPVEPGIRYLGLKGRLSAALTRPPLRRRHRRMLERSHVLASVPEVLSRLSASARARASVVPFGIELRPYSQTALPDTPTVLYVGRVSPEKRVGDLIEAFAQLPEHLGARMLVGGDGPDLPHIRRLVAEHRVGDRVELLGTVQREDVPALLARGTVLASAAVGEPFGMTTLEAMAAGRPVIGIDLNGPRYLIDEGRGGHRVAPRDVSGLAAAMTALLSDRRRATEMGCYNRGRVEGEFSYDRVIPQLEAAYVTARDER